MHLFPLLAGLVLTEQRKGFILLIGIWNRHSKIDIIRDIFVLRQEIGRGADLWGEFDGRRGFWSTL